MNCPVCSKECVSLGRHVMAKRDVERSKGLVDGGHIDFAASHYTDEWRREQRRLKSQRMRAKNPEKFREIEKKRYPARREVRRVKAFSGKACRACEILLASKYGASDSHGGRRVMCNDHSYAVMPKLVRSTYMKIYRKRKKKIKV